MWGLGFEDSDWGTSRFVKDTSSMGSYQLQSPTEGSYSIPIRVKRLYEVFLGLL